MIFLVSTVALNNRLWICKSTVTFLSWETQDGLIGMYSVPNVIM